MASRNRKPEQRRFRIRPCNGNKGCWGLFALREDGTGDDVEFVPMASDARRAA